MLLGDDPGLALDVPVLTRTMYLFTTAAFVKKPDVTLT